MYNLFISHAWDYNSDYYRLIDLLNNAPYFTYRNYSVPEHDRLNTSTDQALEVALYRQIAPCSCVLIIAGMYYAHKYWLQKEIDIANYYKKPIIVVRPWGQERMPHELMANEFHVVYWQSSSIVDAIRQYSV